MWSSSVGCRWILKWKPWDVSDSRNVGCLLRKISSPEWNKPKRKPLCCRRQSALDSRHGVTGFTVYHVQLLVLFWSFLFYSPVPFFNENVYSIPFTRVSPYKWLFLVPFEESKLWRYCCLYSDDYIPHCVTCRKKISAEQRTSPHHLIMITMMQIHHIRYISSHVAMHLHLRRCRACPGLYSIQEPRLLLSLYCHHWWVSGFHIQGCLFLNLFSIEVSAIMSSTSWGKGGRENK